MAASQYIYILFNPAHKNLLKIGRTNRSPEERAQELSASTGVPHSFIVAYECEVADSVLAEQFIHEELTRTGFRTNPSREFFEITLKDAVAVVNRICSALPSTSDESTAMFEEPTDNHGYEFLTNGRMCMQGTDNVLQDFGKALTCFERAISLGNKEAYIYLSEIYLWGLGVRKNPRQAIDLLNDGAKAGNHECLYHLWYIYSGTTRNLYGDHSERSPDEINTGNAETVFKWYLDAMEKSCEIVERTRLYSYMEWACSLPNNVRGKIPGRHSGALLDALVLNIRSQIVQIRLAREGGLEFSKALDTHTGKPLSLGPCRRRLNSVHLCRLNSGQGLKLAA